MQQLNSNIQFTVSECEQIISEGTDMWLRKDDDDRLRMNRAFLPSDYWAMSRISKAARQLGYDDLQLADAQYDEASFVQYPLGGVFSMHDDVNLSKNRTHFWKLTCVIQLSDPSTYEGGKLKIGSEYAPDEQGTMICFPSNTLHEVEPVTSGERFVLVHWCVSEINYSNKYIRGQHKAI